MEAKDTVFKTAFPTTLKKMDSESIKLLVPLVLIFEESPEISIDAWDALFFGVAEIKEFH